MRKFNAKFTVVRADGTGKTFTSSYDHIIAAENSSRVWSGIREFVEQLGGSMRYASVRPLDITSSDSPAVAPCGLPVPARHANTEMQVPAAVDEDKEKRKRSTAPKWARQLGYLLLPKYEPTVLEV